MKIRRSIQIRNLACAIVGAAALFAAGNAQAVFTPLPVGTPENLGVGQPLTTISPAGAYVASLESGFQDPNFPIAPGLFRSVVVDRGGGLLDFYYQVVNLSTDPIDEMFRLEIGGFGVGAIEVAYATSLGSITGLPAFSSSITPTAGNTVFSADRQVNLPQLPAPVNFDFDSAMGFGTGVPATDNNILAGEISNWLVVRTDFTTYGFSGALVNGASVGAPVALAPIPEPSTILFGVALFGVCASRRRRDA